ncbi:MAG: AGE family epimerase/isomerase [Negativicutes bacterium]|nr:AGE family epimerase/isomerase [Negativicutes bacterium]
MNEVFTCGKTYYDELAGVIDFWQIHSPDWEYGGYFTCLDRQGRVYDRDKFIWLQARQVWMFSTLYSRWQQRPDWLKMAELGYRFLLNHGRDGSGNWFFALDRQGRPQVAPYNIFSDCFACMALARYGLAAGDEQATAIAAATFRNILVRRDNPKGRWNKAWPGSRPLRGFSLPMILCNLGRELTGVIEHGEIERLTDQVIAEVLEVFHDRQRGLIRENVLADGSFADCFDGRLTNPGHGLEAMWFIMEIAAERGDRALIDRCCQIALNIAEWGWDNQYGGLFYFLDIDGHPPDKLEWDQKLWWVHIEAMVALAMAWKLTGNCQAGQWFERVADYTFQHFPDRRYGEWFGYLNRRGEVLLPLKGGKWKGCFHIPRGLLRLARLFGGGAV